MLFNLEKINKKDTKINLMLLTFFIRSHKKIKEKSLHNLTDTAKEFFHLLYKKKVMEVILLDDQLQELMTDPCVIFIIILL